MASKQGKEKGFSFFFQNYYFLINDCVIKVF